MTLKTYVLVMVCCVCLSCAGRKQPLDDYSESQKSKLVERTAYNQADFSFWVAFYEPTVEDLEGLRAAWIEHSQAFPESKTISELRKEIEKENQKVALVALYMSAFENADLKNKSLGWSIAPVPFSVVELPEADAPLRILMPVNNNWARYFILKYSPETWLSSPLLVISNPASRVDLVKPTKVLVHP